MRTRNRLDRHCIEKRWIDLFRQYLIVGGMPQAVEAYISSHDFDEVDQVKRRILNLYRDDIRKHARGYEMKELEMFFYSSGFRTVQVYKKDKGVFLMAKK